MFSSKVSDGWSEFRDFCHRGDECRIIEGFAECVAILKEACDLKIDKERCVAGKKQFCSPLSLYRGDTFWDGKLARWVNLEDSRIGHFSALVLAESLTFPPEEIRSYFKLGIYSPKNISTSPGQSMHFATRFAMHAKRHPRRLTNGNSSL